MPDKFSFFPGCNQYFENEFAKDLKHLLIIFNDESCL